MTHKELKELIYNLEDILKLDKRFKKNGDNKYKKDIKTLYINTLQSKNNLNKIIYIKPTQQHVVQKQECPVIQKQECPVIQKQECPVIQKQECPAVQKQECPAVQKQNYCIDEKIKHLNFILKVNDQLDDIENNNKK